MSFPRKRKLSPFTHVEEGPLLDRLYKLTRPAASPPKAEPEETPPATAKPLIYGSGLAADDEVAEEPPPG